MSDRPRWSRIPPAIASRPDLSDRAKVIYGALFDRADQEGYCFPSLDTIGADVGRVARTVRRGTEELVSAGVLERRPQWQTPDSPQLFDTPGDGRERSANRYRLLVGVGDSPVRKVGATSVPKVGATSVPKVGDRVGDRVGATSVPLRGDKRRGDKEKEILPAVSANSSHPTSRAEEEADLDEIITAVRGRRSPPLSRDQAREGRKIARDRLRAGWSPDQIVGALTDTTAFTTAAVDFAASGSKRAGRSSAAQRSAAVLNEAIRGEQ
jgi:hypothetical protein